MSDSLQSQWVGTWDYRSYHNLTFAEGNDDDSLIYGQGTIIIYPTDQPNVLKGTIGDAGRTYWELELTGSITYGNPSTVRFQGQGGLLKNSDNPNPNQPCTWIYEYVGYLVNPWQNGVNQPPTFVGSMIRQIPHPSGKGMHHAGEVGSFFCVKENASSYFGERPKVNTCFESKQK